MVQILLRKTLSGLEPEDGTEAALALQRIPLGGLVVCDIKDPRQRSSQQHKFFFSLLNKVWANQTHFKTVDHLRKALLIRLGYYDKVVYRNGDEIRIEKSLAYDKMPREEFDQLVQNSIQFIAEEVIPNLDNNLLRREIENMCGIQ